MKKRIPAFLLCMLLLASCALPGKRMQKYQQVYLDVFDTVTTLTGFEASEKAFREKADAVHEALLEYHRLFDIYNDYPGLVNLKTVNDSAGLAPVSADPRILALLKDARGYYDLTQGRVNIALGSVLLLWHEAREAAIDAPGQAALPDAAALESAAQHCRMEELILDEAAGTVFLQDPEMRLDVGAIAKGWSAEQVSKLLPEGYLLNLGGNTVATGPKPDGSGWTVGVQSPDSENEYLCLLPLNRGSAVTSGDYQRYFLVDGQRYHHIIDPDTRMPSAYWRSVSILCPDSGLADCLSTALFLLPLEEGSALAEKCGIAAMWVDADGQIFTCGDFPLSEN